MLCKTWYYCQVMLIFFFFFGEDLCQSFINTVLLTCVKLWADSMGAYLWNSKRLFDLLCVLWPISQRSRCFAYKVLNPTITKNECVELFSSSHSLAVRSNWDPPFWHNFISGLEAEKLSLPVSNDDISAGFWSPKAFKARVLMAFMRDFFTAFGCW